MSAIVISSGSESDSDFERDLAEAKRQSILESRLNRNDEGKVSLVLHLVVLYNNKAHGVSRVVSEPNLWSQGAYRLEIIDKHPMTKGSG